MGRKVSPATCRLAVGQLGTDRLPGASRAAVEFCVVTCVVTLASLPQSEGVGRCRSGTGEGRGTAGKLA
jgi:hypothetical protein